MADGKLRTFTDEEMDVLSRVIKRERTKPINTNKETKVDVIPQAPEVYVAKVPDDGIAAITTVDDPGSDEVASEECDIFKLVYDGSSQKMELKQAHEFKKLVYNISLSSIEPPYAIVTRTKYGYWIATPVVKLAWIEYTLHADGGDLEAGDIEHLVTVTEYHFGVDEGDTVTVQFEEKWEANVDNVGKAILGSDGNYHNLVIDCLTE